MMHLVLYFIAIWFLTEGIVSPLYTSIYHCSDELPVDARFIKQVPILDVPPGRCNITTCHTSTKDNKGYHRYCYANICKLGAYHCLHDDKSIVHFCEDFEECDVHVHHIVKIKDEHPRSIDLYELPCPNGYVQPYTNHSCFAQCVVDNSFVERSTKFPGYVVHDLNNSEAYLTDKPAASNMETTGPLHGAVEILYETEEHGLSGLDIVFVLLLSVAVIVLVILVAMKIKSYLSYRHDSQNTGPQEQRRPENVANNTWSNSIKHKFNLNNVNGVVINIDNEKQTEALLPGTGANVHSNAGCDTTTASSDSSNVPSMENLKDDELSEDVTEGGRTRGDGQSLHGSQTIVKQPVLQSF